MSNPHDALFRRAFSNRENAVGELRCALPPDLLEHLDLESLEIVDGTFTDQDLAQRYTDQLYLVPIDGGTGFVYVLFEHQSSTDPLMPFRLLSYMVRIWEKFLTKNKSARSLPPIVPLVLSHDDGSWRASRDMHGLFPDELIARPDFARSTPQFSYFIDDLSKVSTEELKARRLSAYARVVLWALRDGRSEQLLQTASCSKFRPAKSRTPVVARPEPANNTSGHTR